MSHKVGQITGIALAENHIEITFTITRANEGVDSCAKIKMPYEEAAIWENVQLRLQEAWDARTRHTDTQLQIQKALLGRVFTVEDHDTPPPTPPPHDTPPEAPTA